MSRFSLAGFNLERIGIDPDMDVGPQVTGYSLSHLREQFPELDDLDDVVLAPLFGVAYQAWEDQVFDIQDRPVEAQVLAEMRTISSPFAQRDSNEMYAWEVTHTMEEGDLVKKHLYKLKETEEPVFFGVRAKLISISNSGNPSDSSPSSITRASPVDISFYAGEGPAENHAQHMSGLFEDHIEDKTLSELILPAMGNLWKLRDLNPEVRDFYFGSCYQRLREFSVEQR